MTPLASIPDDNAASDAASNQGTPSKPPVQRPARIAKKPVEIEQENGSDTEESEDEFMKKLQERRLKPGPNKKWTKPPEKEIKPLLIRDRVSEHAIKPTVELFEKKMAAGQGFTYNTKDSSNRKYNWDVDWNMPATLMNERESHAVAAELEHRGIKTDTQYSNFWYNLTMKFSRLAGSPIPLFTAKKKALDTFVEEAMRNQKARDRNRKKLTKTQRKKLKQKKKQPQGVDAFLIPGDTDEESNNSDSDSDSSGVDLMAKLRVDIDKQRKVSGGGTSCGRRKK
ncbi:hypothetical protein F53441_966 [Fusarium austroafricanum]|uniref:Uncharacterized protein n=1 Tax=Fusarium austroafricanum TaxID=2364996 RepID=A0A8H4P5N0_9HYPO|nr:hypothetical protein F53441_966 [Fusarium austroafricanum]